MIDLILTHRLVFVENGISTPDVDSEQQRKFTKTNIYFLLYIQLVLSVVVNVFYDFDFILDGFMISNAPFISNAPSPLFIIYNWTQKENLYEKTSRKYVLTHPRVSSFLQRSCCATHRTMQTLKEVSVKIRDLKWYFGLQ